MNIVYLVHDLNDPAVERRVRMLAPHLRGGLTVLGFHRGAHAPVTISGSPAITFGRTEDAALTRRAASVGIAAARLGRHRALFESADLIIARFVETLALAVIARARFCPGAPVVYECLDIHTIMTGPGVVGRSMRGVEGLLLDRSAALVTSSPAFVSEHFDRIRRDLPPVILLENKVLADEVPAEFRNDTGIVRPAPPAAEVPWRIGWFGNLRCRRSLHLLAELCALRPGLVEVVARGRVAYDLMPEFDDVVRATPGLRFEGAYDRASELAKIYAEVHFVWALDYTQKDANSAWLLPNRLYEGSLFGGIAIAASNSATGTWLARHRCGLLLDEPIDTTLDRLVTGMTPQRYLEARTDMCAVPISDLVVEDEEAVALVRTLEGLAHS